MMIVKMIVRMIVKLIGNVTMVMAVMMMMAINFHGDRNGGDESCCTHTQPQVGPAPRGHCT